MFLATVGIGEWSLLNWVKDTDRTQKNPTSCHRGETHDFMRTFLQDLPKVPSHYCRSSTLKQYLEPVFQSKLAVHNFTVYDMSSHNAICCVWHEGEGALSASEFASCVTNFLSEHKEHEEYILWSDGCGYQNRNSVLSNALLKFSREMKKVVTRSSWRRGIPKWNVTQCNMLP